MKQLLLFLCFCLAFTEAYPQTFILSGSLRSSADTSAIPGAALRLETAGKQARPGSTLIAVTEADGSFRFEKVIPGQYILKIEFLGFEPYARTLRARPDSSQLGIIFLKEATLTLGAVEVTAQASLGKQMGDTTQFNAEAFKTAPNANAENLIEKMPGIQMRDGQIEAQGEAVQQILVDGKPFFEGDVQAALKNLPAEIIQHIHVFDKQSDQAEFSGFDDGNRLKTINIVTKPDRKRGRFGQASLGYGTDRRYMAGASVNFFSDERRFTVTGVSNDINSAGYSIGETPGSRVGGGSEGNTTTNRISLNYNDEWGEKIEISGNYTFHHREDFRERLRFRDYVLSSDSGQVYAEENNNHTNWTGQWLRMRLEYDPNEKNELVFEPRLLLEQNREAGYFFGRTENDMGPVNQTENNVRFEGTEFEIQNELHYRHRFEKAGRTFSMHFHNEFDRDKGERFRLADNVYYSRQDPNESLNQHINPYRRYIVWDGSLSYTEPLGDSARMQIEYSVGNNMTRSDERAFNFIEETEEYTLLDTLLSNTFRNEYLTQEIELGYEYNIKKLNIEVEAEYQRAGLKNDRVFPKIYAMERVFHSLLPSLEVEYRFSDSKNLRLDYRTGTNEPSIEQLQDVINNSNPLHLYMGNPDLKQSYRNQLSLRYRSFDPEDNKSLYIRLDGSLSRNTISNNTIIADRPVQLSEDIVLERGSQLTRPLNLEESNWDLRTYFGYGQPVALISSNIHLNGSVGYSRRPGMINDALAFSTSNNFEFGISVNSNISEKIDFNFSTRSAYRIVENSLRPQLNANYFNQSTHFRGNLIFWKGVVFRTELNHRVNGGMSAGYDNSYLFWNLSLSKLLFPQQRGEICLSVNDLLKQNNSIGRNVTDLYIEDERSNMLQQFFMLSFTYSLRQFAGGKG